MATLHNRTANGQSVDFDQDCAYLDRLVRKLQNQQVIGALDADELYWLRDRWREKPRMWEDNQVLVHGDATPSNLLFGRGLSVIAIDLERMKRADRTFDLGRITGELQHYFLQASGNKHTAEPFIGHFLWEYACHFPDLHHRPVTPSRWLSHSCASLEIPGLILPSVIGSWKRQKSFCGRPEWRFAPCSSMSTKPDRHRNR